MQDEASVVVRMTSHDRSSSEQSPELKNNQRKLSRKNGGRRPGAGRKEGVPNKLTADVKAAIMESFSEVGGAEDLGKVARRVRDADATFHSVQKGRPGCNHPPSLCKPLRHAGFIPLCILLKKATWETNLPQLVNRGRG